MSRKLPSRSRHDQQAGSASSPRTSHIHRRGRWIAAGAATIALTGSALFNRASKGRAEADTPPAGAFVDVDGVRLHYVDQGAGEIVVLLHGNGVMLQDFGVSGVLGLAAKHHRVIAFDRPGFGYSTRPRTRLWTASAQARLIASALRVLGVKRAILVGHSWGTIVALAMALDEPDLVAGLVLLSGYYYGTARPDVGPFSAPAIPLIGDLMANTISPLAGRLIAPALIRASFSPAPVASHFATFPLAMSLRPSQVRATAADTAMMVPTAITLSRRYGELTMPIIAMAGEGDRIAHVHKHAARFVEEVPGAELRLLGGQGHLFHYGVPDAVVAAIDDVIERAP